VRQVLRNESWETQDLHRKSDHSSAEFKEDERQTTNVISLAEREFAFAPKRSELVCCLERDAQVGTLVASASGNNDPVLGKASVNEGDARIGDVERVNARDERRGGRVDDDDGDLMRMSRAEAPVL
jgi:hypothetical protein